MDVTECSVVKDWIVYACELSNVTHLLLYLPSLGFGALQKSFLIRSSASLVVYTIASFLDFSAEGKFLIFHSTFLPSSVLAEEGM